MPLPRCSVASFTLSRALCSSDHPAAPITEALVDQQPANAQAVSSYGGFSFPPDQVSEHAALAAGGSGRPMGIVIVDGQVGEQVVAQLRALPGVRSIKVAHLGGTFLGAL